VIALPPIADPNTDEWYSARSTGIGASEAAAACGLSRWETPHSIYCRKLGLIPPTEDNDAIRLGRKLEPVVISEFVERTGLAVAQHPCPMYRHPEHNFMLATPDAELESGDLLEAKSMGHFVAKALGDQGSDDIPQEIVIQCQQQLAVTCKDVCHVAVLIDGRTLRLFRVERHDKLIAKIAELEADLWERIQRQEPPAPDWQHPRTPELIRQLYGVTSGKTVELPTSVASLWVEQRDLGDEIKMLEQKREALRAQVLHEMADASIATFPEAVFELSRSEIHRKEYVVKECSFISIRERKVKVNGKR
jgi:putative phage-type endonuclease